VRARTDREDALADDLATTLDTPLLVGRRAGEGVDPVIEFVPVGASWAGERPRVECDPTAAEREDVTLVDGRRPVVVRSSPLGSLASAVAAALERGADRSPSRLPTWLAPTQVRFVPVRSDHVDRCDELADDLSVGVRVDVDAREIPVGERIERAERDWVPYYAVVGGREAEGESFPVTDRAAREQRQTTVDQLSETVLDRIDDHPRPRASVPARVPDASR
jgi:threonyl-tRNA synthetase